MKNKGDSLGTEGLFEKLKDQKTVIKEIYPKIGEIENLMEEIWGSAYLDNDSINGYVGCSERGLTKFNIDFQTCSNPKCSSCVEFNKALKKELYEK